MQLTYFVPFAVLCSVVLAAPSLRRGDSDDLIQVLAYLDHDLNNASVDILKRDDVAQVVADIQDDLNDIDIKVLTPKSRGDDDDVVQVLAYLDHVLDNASVDVLKRDDVAQIVADIQDDLDGLDIKILAPQSRSDDDDVVQVLAYLDHVLNNASVDILKRDDVAQIVADIQDDLNGLDIKILAPPA
ncbi:hypothetical protein BDR07DRAFT_437808 [Suillus spraguei]|nr:hypothetical protein BDR07DRAFT_437808 [Suillus spraguei]